jgi:hypothetical protein
MQQTALVPERPAEPGFGAWFAFWVPLFALGLAALLGAVYAAADDAPGDYACGLWLSLAAIVLAFLLIKRRFDGAATDCGSFLLVDDMANLIAVIVIFAILGLAGLIVADGNEVGGLHDGGVALFVVSALAIFLSMKHVFDNLARRSRG